MSARRARSAGSNSVSFAFGPHDATKPKKSPRGAHSRDPQCDFYSGTDYSKVNTKTFQWQRADTFRTPRGDSRCASGNEEPFIVALQEIKKEIISSCRSDLKSTIEIIRQDSDVFFKKILSQGKRVIAHQNETSFQLLAEMGRVTSDGRDGQLLAEMGNNLTTELQKCWTQTLQAVGANADTFLGQHNKAFETMSKMNSQLKELVEDAADARRSKAAMEHQQKLLQQQQQQQQSHSQSQDELLLVLQRVAQHLDRIQASETQLQSREVLDTMVRMLSDMKQEVRYFRKKLDESAMRDLDVEGRLLKITESIKGANVVEQQKVEKCHQAGIKQREQDLSGVADVVSDRISRDLSMILHDVRLVKADVNLKVTRDTRCKDVKVLISTGRLEQESHSKLPIPSVAGSILELANQHCRSNSALREMGDLDTKSKLASAAAAQRSAPRSAVTKRPQSASSTVASGSDDVFLACSQTTGEQDCGGSIVSRDRLWPASADMEEHVSNVVARERTVLDVGDEAALREAFDCADTNDNGSISQLEAVKALRSSDTLARAFGFKGRLQVRQEDGTRELFRKAFQEVDTDGDNSITWEEFVAYAKSHDREGLVHVEESISGISCLMNSQDVMGDTPPLASFDVKTPCLSSFSASLPGLDGSPSFSAAPVFQP